MMSKLGSGFTVTTFECRCTIWLLQASLGNPLMNMPQDPQIPMRHDDLQDKVQSSCSLIHVSPSSTVIPFVTGT
jgi:hypothetical protein